MPQERNSATSPYGQCSVPTTEQQIPTSYGNGETMYPTSEGNMAMYTDSHNSLVVSGTGRTYSSPGSPQATLFTATTTTSSTFNQTYQEDQLPLAINGEATLVIPEGNMAYANAFGKSNNPISFVGSQDGQLYGDDHQNEACSTRNSNIEKLHNRMLLNQHSFPVNPLDADDIYFQDYSSSSQGNYLSAEAHSDVNLTLAQYSSAGVSSMVTGVEGGGGGNGMETSNEGFYLDNLGFPNTTFGENVYDDDVSGIIRDFAIGDNSELMAGETLEMMKFFGTDMYSDPSSFRPPEPLSTPVDSAFINGFDGFNIQYPVQAAETQNHSLHQAEEPLSSESLVEALSNNSSDFLVVEDMPLEKVDSISSRNQVGGESVQEQSTIEDDLAMIRMMKVPTQPPVAPASLGLKGHNHMVPTTRIPSPQSTAGSIVPPSPVHSSQVPPSTPSTPYSQACASVTPVQVTTAPPPSPSPSTPKTPATPCTSQKGPFELSSYTESGKRICELGIREDLAPDQRNRAGQAVLYSLDACQKFERCLQKPCDLKVAIDARAELCSFNLDRRLGKLQFTMPQECVHLDKWLHVNRGKIDLRDRQLVLQQVVNILAAVHTNGNEDKLCLWGSFVVWVAPDMRVYILLDFPEMLCKMENCVNDVTFDPRIEDVKAVYSLYSKIFLPFVNQDSAWVSPGVKQLIESFERLVMQPSSVYRMAECARILGEKRLCKLEVELLTLKHYVYCIEHELLRTVLGHVTPMIPRNICDRWGVFWEKTKTPVECDAMASAHQRIMKLNITTAPVVYGRHSDRELSFYIGSL